MSRSGNGWHSPGFVRVGVALGSDHGTAPATGPGSVEQLAASIATVATNRTRTIGIVINHQTLAAHRSFFFVLRSVSGLRTKKKR
jgi:hypothetical protein